MTNRRKWIVVSFVGILFVPIALSFFHKVTGKDCDVKLNGYTDVANNPTWEANSFLDGIFQQQYTNWINQELKPRGIFTRTYNQIQYWLTGKVGTIIVGKNGNLFNGNVVNAELCINGYPNYREAKDYQQKLKEYTEKLVLLNERLSDVGKTLVFYLSPSKADYCFNDIPQKYIGIMPENRLTGADYISSLLKKTDIPYLICRDMKEDLTYPAYTIKGTHWSQTFIQETIQKLITLISESTGNNYRNLVLNTVEESPVPYYTDSDIYNLLNIWGNGVEETYYMYQNTLDEKDYNHPMRMLLQGTSFSDGLRVMMQKTIPDNMITYINRNTYVIEKNGNTFPFTDWNEIDLYSYLDNNDIVCIESTEEEIGNCSNGFVDYLLESLGSYTPKSSQTDFPKMYDATSENVLRMETAEGLDWNGDGFFWGKKEFKIGIQDEEIFRTGLELDISIPSQLFNQNSQEEIVKIWVNDHLVAENAYNAPGDYSIIIEPRFIEENDMGQSVIIHANSSKTFCPKELGIGEDSRELAIALYYAGRKK